MLAVLQGAAVVGAGYVVLPAVLGHYGGQAVQAGRLAYLSGRIPRKMYANASSPIEGLVGR